MVYIVKTPHLMDFCLLAYFGRQAVAVLSLGFWVGSGEFVCLAKDAEIVSEPSGIKLFLAALWSPSKLSYIQKYHCVRNRVALFSG